MRRDRFSLDAFQSWMQAVLVHPGGAPAGLRSPAARRLLSPAELSGVVRDRRGLGAVGRLQIYASMYPLRMRDSLRSDYPALASLLGEEAFAELVRDFTARHPSRSFTLARLGDHLPEFVVGWGPLRQRSLRTGVARLESAAASVFDATESRPVDPAALASALAVAGDAVLLVPAPAFAILAVPPGAVGVLDAHLAGTAMPAAAGRGHVHVAFYRRDFTVLRRTLEPFPGRLLTALSEGAPLGEALSVASRRERARRPAPVEAVEWISEWLRLGFFERVEAFRSPERA